jgi:hypothetical protein
MKKNKKVEKKYLKKKTKKKRKSLKKKKRKNTVDYYYNPQCFVCVGTMNSPHDLVYLLIISKHCLEITYPTKH